MEWLAAMPACACPHLSACNAQAGADRCSQVPNNGEQMVRSYGYYSDVSRGQRKKANEDGLVPCTLQPEQSSKGHLKNGARLIQKVHDRAIDFNCIY